MAHGLVSIPRPVLGGLCGLACLPFQTSNLLNLFQKETQDSFWSQGCLPHKFILLKQWLQIVHMAPECPLPSLPAQGQRMQHLALPL